MLATHKLRMSTNEEFPFGSSNHFFSKFKRKLKRFSVLSRVMSYLGIENVVSFYVIEAVKGEAAKLLRSCNKLVVKDV